MHTIRSGAMPLSMDSTEFRRVGHALVDTLAGFLAALPDRPVGADESPQGVRALIAAERPLPEHGTDAEQLLQTAADVLTGHSLFNGHPRFFGYITASPAPIGMLGDLLASAVNANVGAWQLAPVATEIEAQAVRWIAEFVGYPDDCGGLFVSGGNMANLVGLLAARTACAGDDIRRAGVAASTTGAFRVYASTETHTWLQKAVDLAGLGTNAIRWIGTDDALRMDVGRLRAAIARDRADGDLPMLVIGTAGSVSTGAVDPLAEIADLCRDEGLWLHVDGAYGAFAAALPDASADLRALARADSVALDPHKWLYAPLEVGCVLVRRPDALRATFAYHPPYYHFGEAATNYVDFGPQNSRGFRALKVWLALQQAGRAGYVQMIGDDIALSRLMHASIAEHPALEACTQALSICTFRYVPPDLRRAIGRVDVEAYLDRLNEALLERIQASGEAFVSNAVVHGRYLLRACIVNFHTRDADVRALPGIVVRHGAALDATLRTATLRTATHVAPTLGERS